MIYTHQGPFHTQLPKHSLHFWGAGQAERTEAALDNDKWVQVTCQFQAEAMTSHMGPCLGQSHEMETAWVTGSPRAEQMP